MGIHVGRSSDQLACFETFEFLRIDYCLFNSDPDDKIKSLDKLPAALLVVFLNDLLDALDVYKH